MEENPFDLRLNFAPSQNYEEDNPFDRYFERENKKREFWRNFFFKYRCSFDREIKFN